MNTFVQKSSQNPVQDVGSVREWNLEHLLQSITLVKGLQ